MTPTAQCGFDSTNRRGHWLRCFLTRTICVAILIAVICGVSHAQLDPQGPTHLWHLHGVVVNGTGKPAAGETVNLVRDEKVLYSTKTDASGRFEFKHVSGHYWLRMHPVASSIVNRPVIVGDEALMYLKKKAFFVILGPGACTDDCSQVFTSKGDFDKAIKRNTQGR